MEQTIQYKKIYALNFSNQEKKELFKQTGMIGRRKGSLKQ